MFLQGLRMKMKKCSSCSQTPPPNRNPRPTHTPPPPGNGISERGAVVLSNALCSNSTLQTLNLGYNRLGDEGILALSSAVGTNRTLVKLLLGREWCGKPCGRGSDPHLPRPSCVLGLPTKVPVPPCGLSFAWCTTLAGCRAEAEGPAITELCSQLNHNYTLRALAVELPAYGQAYIDRNKQAHVVRTGTWLAIS